ncbi:MAG: hypothetical protein OXG88_05825 [Gammaproteobacteria bacterium]|nr:hypothetical protein [Gammaproteobacteria bacterium]
MLNINLIRVFTSYIVFGLTLVPHVHGHSVQEQIDNQGFWSSPETEPFLPATDEHRAAWNRVLEDCFPFNTRDALSDHCMVSLGEYFANEPVWSYYEHYLYGRDGWRPLVRNFDLRRNHSRADFLNPDVPFWRHIFDDQIDQRQELSLRVFKDSKCTEILKTATEGMQVHLTEQCAARELYKYAAYLGACMDASKLLAKIQTVMPEKAPKYGGLNEFEMGLQLLEERVSDEARKSAAKHRMEKSYLHAYWVTAQCSQHGFILRPGRAVGSYTSTEEKLPWSVLNWSIYIPSHAEEKKYHGLLSYTHRSLMKIAMKSGDDWAIRSGYLGRTYIAEFADDLMQRYPLLMHRALGDPLVYGGYGRAFPLKEHARHRAKAYLLLVEAAGEEFARSEIDPTKLTKEIKYVESGGLLTSPHSRAKVDAERLKRLRKSQEKQLLKEAQGELQ